MYMYIMDNGDEVPVQVRAWVMRARHATNRGLIDIYILVSGLSFGFLTTMAWIQFRVATAISQGYVGIDKVVWAWSDFRHPEIILKHG